MRNITSIFISLIMALFFIGCAGGSVSTPSNEKLVKINDEATEGKRSLLIKIKTTGATPLQKIASALNEAAKVFKSKGITHFKINPKYLMDKSGLGISNYVTDLKSLEEFCFPKGDGLETKCEKLRFKTLKLWIAGTEPVFYTPTWSVEQVLNDSYVQKNAILKGHTTMTMKEAFKKY